jgi:hypothetical protein
MSVSLHDWLNKRVLVHCLDHTETNGLLLEAEEEASFVRLKIGPKESPREILLNRQAIKSVTLWREEDEPKKPEVKRAPMFVGNGVTRPIS